MSWNEPYNIRCILEILLVPSICFEYRQLRGRRGDGILKATQREQIKPDRKGRGNVMFKTVRSKFSLGYISLILLIVVLGAISIFTMRNISGTIEGLITTNYNSIDRLNKMKDALWNQQVAAMEYIYGDSVQAAVNFEQYKSEFRRYYEEEAATIILANEQVYIEEIGARFERYQESFQFLTSYDLNNPEEFQMAVEYLENRMTAYRTLLDDAMKNLYISNETALFARRDEATEMARTATRMFMIIFPLAAIGGYWMARTYTKRFLAPIEQITRQIKMVRQGNLRSGSLIPTQDEFGMMADEFNRMLQRLSEFERSTLGSLVEERSKTDTIAKSINEPMVVLDEEGTILLINHAFGVLAHTDEEHAVNLPVGELLPQGQLSSYLLQVIAQPQSVVPDKTICLVEHSNDQFYHVAVTPIPGVDGENTGFIVILHDVTEMKKLEKARGDFIATISHEFKTPLTSIVMGADLMKNELVGRLNEDQREIVDTICEDSQRLENLVGEMLELSRIESARTIYKFERCPVEGAIRTSTHQFQAMAQRNQIELTTQIEPDLPDIWADFSKITWVLNNLLSNAMKYTGEGGSVAVEAIRAGKWIQVSVSDTGIGVPSEFADQIFEKFVQVKGYDIEVRGSGVGLAAAKEIITAHEGQIWCDTTQKEGSKFCFTLPVYEKEDHDGTASSNR